MGIKKRTFTQTKQPTTKQTKEEKDLLFLKNLLRKLSFPVSLEKGSVYKKLSREISNEELDLILLDLKSAQNGSFSNEHYNEEELLFIYNCGASLISRRTPTSPEIKASDMQYLIQKRNRNEALLFGFVRSYKTYSTMPTQHLADKIRQQRNLLVIEYITSKANAYLVTKGTNLTLLNKAGRVSLKIKTINILGETIFEELDLSLLNGNSSHPENYIKILNTPSRKEENKSLHPSLSDVVLRKIHRNIQGNAVLMEWADTPKEISSFLPSTKNSKVFALDCREYESKDIDSLLPENFNGMITQKLCQWERSAFVGEGIKNFGYNFQYSDFPYISEKNGRYVIASSWIPFLYKLTGHNGYIGRKGIYEKFKLFKVNGCWIQDERYWMDIPDFEEHFSSKEVCDPYHLKVFCPTL